MGENNMQNNIWTVLCGCGKSLQDFAAFALFPLWLHASWRKCVRSRILEKMRTQELPTYGIPRGFTADREIVLAAVENYNPRALEAADPALKADKEFVLAAVKMQGEALEYAAFALQSDREIVLAAVTNVGEALQYASQNLKQDREIVLAAIQLGCVRRVFNENYADRSLRSDREIVLAAVQLSGLQLGMVDDAFKAYPEIVKAAVRNNGAALSCATPELRADHSVVLEAVQSIANGELALAAADASLRRDRQIVVAAVAKDPFAIKSAEQSLAFELAERAGLLSEYLAWKNYDISFLNALFDEEATPYLPGKEQDFIFKTFLKKVPALQEYAQALSSPFLVTVLGTQPLPTVAGGGAAQGQRWKIKVCTISGTEELVECTGDAYGNLSTASLRTPLATQLAKHPAALSFVLPSGTVCKEGSDSHFSAVYFLQKTRMPL